MSTKKEVRSVESLMTEFNHLHTVSITIQSGMMVGNNTTDDAAQAYENLEKWVEQTLTAERTAQREMVEEILRKAKTQWDYYNDEPGTNEIIEIKDIKKIAKKFKINVTK